MLCLHNCIKEGGELFGSRANNIWLGVRNPPNVCMTACGEGVDPLGLEQIIFGARDLLALERKIST